MQHGVELVQMSTSTFLHINRHVKLRHSTFHVHVSNLDVRRDPLVVLFSPSDIRAVHTADDVLHIFRQNLRVSN